jgi:aryl-alcohol dehydrogenase-like predicted oxidoreductase
MERRTLGKSGIRASRIGLGCATFGREVPEETAFRIVGCSNYSGAQLEAALKLKRVGKYTPDRTVLPKGTRFDIIPGHADVYFSDRNFRWMARLQEMAERNRIPAARLAMAWVLQNAAVDVVLVGARTVEHLDNILAAAEHAPWVRRTKHPCSAICSPRIEGLRPSDS